MRHAEDRAPNNPVTVARVVSGPFVRPLFLTMKTYNAHVQFEAIGLRVTAKNAREARKKIFAKIAKLRPVRLLDRNNLFIDAD